MRDAVAQLEAGDAELDRRSAAADRTLSAKGRAMERFENIYQGVKRVTEGLYRLAGERELANRLRRRGIWRRVGGGRRRLCTPDAPGGGCSAAWWPNAWEWVRQVLGIGGNARE